jgi:uncharacterized protein (TIGR02147 family)
VLGEWVHFAILSLLKTDDFKSDPQWIATRLGISPNQVSTALERLLSLEMIQRSEHGEYSRTNGHFRTSDDVADVSIRKFHSQTLELAKESLHRDPIECRDFSAVTMAIDLNQLDRAKTIIRQCQDELMSLLETGQRTEVYRFSCQLFPLTVLKTYSPKGDVNV